MATVGLFEAKTHLSALARRVAKGEEIIVTDRGKPVMRLAPIETEDARVQRGLAALEDARQALAREGATFSVEDILSARDEGRR